MEVINWRKIYCSLNRNSEYIPPKVSHGGLAAVSLNAGYQNPVSFHGKIASIKYTVMKVKGKNMID